MKITKLIKLFVLFLVFANILVLTGCHRNQVPSEDPDDEVDCETNPDHEDCKDPADDYPYSRGFTLYPLKDAITGQALNKFAVGKYEGTDTVVKIPAVWDNKPVIRISAGTFENNEKITKVIIPDSIEQMKENAFSNCTNLTEVVFDGEPKIQAIPDKAFYNCKKLASFVIPTSVTEIGKNAFSQCSTIAELVVPASVKSIGKSAFGGMVSLSKLVVPFIGGGKVKDDNLDVDVLGYVFDTTPSEFTAQIQQQISEKNSRVYYIPTALSIIELVTSDIRIIEFGALSGLKTVSRIILPMSITKFDDNVFLNSTGIMEVCYPGDEADWIKVAGRYSPGNVEILEKVTITYNYGK